MTNFAVAEALAADLAGARVDLNEAQKAMAYLRSKRDPKRFFEYLQAVVNHGHAVIRSRQTLDYYRDLQQICLRHLQGMSYAEMASTLGWALRILRYYRAVPEEVQRELSSPSSRTPTPARATSRADRELPTTQRPPTTDHQPPASNTSPAAQREPPTVGTIFTGKVVKGDNDVFVIQVPGFEERDVVAVLKIEPGVPKFKPGKDSAKVEVISQRKAKDGKTILEVRRPPKSGNPS